ncbi:hypothetical protein [Planktothrix sp.]|uniref:hypothetical protein n=1 Tax=Planktothrix sp. TaxID=3088171 RepID=UPI0038D376E4
MTTETTETTQEKTTKKARAKKSEDGTTRKNITLNESEANELKALADTLQMSESDIIKMAIKAIVDNAKFIVDAQEKTAFKPEKIVSDSISRHCNQLIKQENIGSRNNDLEQAYEIIKSGQVGKYRSIASKLATSVGTNYNTVVNWLKMYHPEELE